MVVWQSRLIAHSHCHLLRRISILDLWKQDVENQISTGFDRDIGSLQRDRGTGRIAAGCKAGPVALAPNGQELSLFATFIFEAVLLGAGRRVEFP